MLQLAQEFNLFLLSFCSCRSLYTTRTESCLSFLPTLLKSFHSKIAQLKFLVNPRAGLRRAKVNVLDGGRHHMANETAGHPRQSRTHAPVLHPH